MTFLSLFSGIGGLDLGLERAGMKCIGQVEIDPFCRRVLAKHWPDVPRWDDVRTFNAGMLKEKPDLVCGGFPCTQTSVAAAIHGSRKGLLGRESGLWFGQLRIIRECRPAWVIVENVGGVAAWEEEIAGGLEGISYVVSRPIVSAQAVGAPHLRERVFFVADVDGQVLSIPWEAEPSPADGIARPVLGRSDWWSSLTRLRRVVDGVPGGVDRRERISACGRAVVPQVAEWIGRRIIEATEGSPAHR